MISNSPSYEFKGKHYIANFINCHCMDLHTIKKGFEQAILKSGATILGKSDYVFENDTGDRIQKNLNTIISLLDYRSI